MSVSICFIYLGAPELGAYMLTSVMSSSCIDPFYIMECPSLSFIIAFVLKSILPDMSIAPCFLVLCICMKYLFPSPHFQSVCVFSSEGSPL